MPALCPICDDDRQFVPEAGQGWTDSDEVSGRYSIIARNLNDHFYELTMAPSFALAQRALLVLSPGGNILWDCLSLLNEPTIEFIKAKGGLKAIAISHPHYYTSMNERAEVGAYHSMRCMGLMISRISFRGRRRCWKVRWENMYDG